jgi:TonB family protein
MAAPPPAPAVAAAVPPVAAALPPGSSAGSAAIAAQPAQPAEIGLPQLGHSLVERVASDHSKDLSKCDDNQDLHGDVTVKFMIDATGKVSKAQVATSLKKPKFIACLLRVLQKFQFPKQGPGGAQGTYTLSFQ